MPYELVNVGAAPDDPASDDVRSAFVKINSLIAGVNAGDLMAVSELTTALLGVLADPTNGPILAAAMIEEIGGDAIAAEMIEDMSPAERLTWLTTMFDTEVVEYATAADVWTGDANGLVRSDALAAADALVTATPSAGVLTLNGANGFNFKVTQTANITDVNPSNLIPGKAYAVRFEQGGAGNFTIVFGLNVETNLPASFAAVTGARAWVVITNIGTTGSPIYEVAMGAASHV